MVARCHDCRSHLGDADGDGFSLGGHHDHLAVANVVGKSQEAGDHELGAVAYRVDGAILDYEALVAEQKSLEGGARRGGGSLHLCGCRTGTAHRGRRAW